MTRFYNKKFDFAVEAIRIDPGTSPTEKVVTIPELSKLLAEIPETYWLVDYKGTKMLFSDELFQRFFVREPAHA